VHEQAEPDFDGSRGAFLRRGAKVAGMAFAGVAAAGGTGLVSAASQDRDRQVLELLVVIEQAEGALYRDVLKGGALDGELKRFAEVVVDQEQVHLATVTKALGGSAPKAPAIDFGAAIREPEAFATAAARLEDLAVAAYNGQAGNVSKQVFLAAARIVSVEARHAAWVRSIQGLDPAPAAADRPQTAGEVRKGLRALGVEA